VVVGDALVDRDVEGSTERLCPDAPVPVLDESVATARPGGAALAAALLAEAGRGVVLVAAIGADEAGRELGSLLADRGVELVNLGLAGPTPEKIRFRSAGQSLLRVDRGSVPSGVGAVTDRARRTIAGAGAVLVADYGRGVAAAPGVRAALSAGRRRPVVWDPHRRGAVPVEQVDVVTPNRSELAALGGGDPSDLAGVTAAAETLRRSWRARGMAVTLGHAGALFVDGDRSPLAVPAEPAGHGDTCGAGDCFAATVAAALADGAVASEAVIEGVRQASAFVAAGGAASLASAWAASSRTGDDPADPGAAVRALGAAAVRALGAARQGITVSAVDAATERAVEVASRHRLAGGTVVAAGGCFDLLHAGHVAMLRAARSLGSCLVVCLNSDASVRRLKGAGRPVAPEDDRLEVLMALDCVDAVAVFDEDTPVRLLERLRPHVFTKGGDYTGAWLPETEALARWGGQAVTLPYLAGRSTTGLLAKAGARSR
jgi:rfaE bifunctional protein nucleotidyltransferase chain/domain/rfaE bifunctional protein kinase chain/domain